MLKSSIEALDTKVTTDLTYIHTSEPVVFPSSVVSFDSFYHILDDEEPLEVEDEDAMVLGNKGDQMFDKSPQ